MSSFISIHPLNPCPNCDSEAVFCESTLIEPFQHFVLCLECGHESREHTSRSAAIEEWNQ